ncbi:hypothetical protein L218DRAFT_265607 [Marasmius fiardii PR-910]|nr:hypothetical protein L218DRAFT_265607 [Marasmius fiardii PR-910]
MRFATVTSFILSAMALTVVANPLASRDSPIPCGNSVNDCPPGMQCCKSINGAVCAKLPPGAIC